MGRARTWTDDQLREAVEACNSLSGVVRALRSAGGAGYDAVKRRIIVLDLDTSHFVSPFGPPGQQVDPRRWSDEDLAEAVASSSSLNQVFSALGLEVGGSQWLALRERIAHLGLDTTHWAERNRVPRPLEHVDDGEIAEALAASRSFAELCRRLDVRGGGGQARVVRRVRELGLSTDHLEGQGWARGRENPGRRRRTPLVEILVAGRPVHQTSTLRERLIEEG